jgi:Phage capsid family
LSRREAHASISVPTALLTAADAGGFVNEGDPLTVRNLNISGPTLWPDKFGTIVAFTDDLIAQAVQDFEAVVRQLLTEACALALDAAMFSADAGSTSRPGPAGIICGVSPIAATSGGGAAALAKDVENLVAALAAVGGGKDVVFVVSPGKAAALKIWAGPKFDYPILASSVVDATTIIAVDTGFFVSAFGAVPEFRTSNEAVAHFEDASPQQISTDGTVAAPVRSLWQTRCTAVRLILRTAWALRVDSGAQYINAVIW